MPLGSFRLNTIARAAGALAETYWLLSYNGTGEESIQGISNGLITTDSSGNVYFGLSTTNATLIGTQDTLIVKLNSGGAFQNVLRINNQTSGSDRVVTAISSGSNVYVGSWNSATVTSNYFHTLTDSLGLSSTYRLNNSGGSATTAGGLRSVWTNGTDLFYAWPQGSTNASTSVGYIASSNLSGTVSWTRQFSNTGFVETVYNTEYDGTNVYVATQNSTTNPVVLSYTAAGASSWQRALTGTGVPNQNINIQTITGLSIMYLGGSRAGSGASITKIDSVVGGGTLAWSRLAATGGNFGAITLDDKTSAASNIYQINYISGTSQAITKFNSSGTILWQRSIAVTGGSVDVWEIKQINATPTAIYILLLISALNTFPVLLKLPADGSKTGSYVVGSFTITWASTTVSYSTPSWTWGSATTFTLSTPTAATQTATTATTSTSGLTATTVSIP